jgi:hypothetical protein
MPRVPWIFEDESSSEIYELECNPNEAQMPSIQKTFSTSYSTAGRPIIFQGRDPVKQISFSGQLLTKEQYDALRLWVKKQKQIKITDDLGRVYWVYLKEFNPSRRPALNYPWLHDFSMSGVVVSWES